MGADRPSGRIPELDGVRGLAAVAVVLFHAFPHGVFAACWSAVDLFFVLSGFLITTIILGRRRSPGFLRGFYARRVFRIWPVYYLTLAGVALANRLSPTGYPTDGWLAHPFFLQNTPRYFGLTPQPFIPTFFPSWSVAVEEQFYLIWPLLLLRFGHRSVPFFAAGLLGLSITGRVVLEDISLLGTRGDGLAFGCFLAWLMTWRTRPSGDRLVGRVVASAGWAGLAYVVAYLIRFGGDPDVGWEAVSSTGFGFLFFGVIGTCVIHQGSTWLGLLRNPVLRWFGTISYAMYLFHMPILSYVPAVLARLGVRSPTAVALLTWGSVVGLPALSWYLFEGPILRWKEGLLRSQSETATVARLATVPNESGSYDDL